LAEFIENLVAISRSEHTAAVFHHKGALKQYFFFGLNNGQKTVVFHQGFNGGSAVNRQIGFKCCKPLRGCQSGLNRPGKSGEIILGLFLPFFPLLAVLTILDKLPVTALISLNPLLDMRRCKSRSIKAAVNPITIPRILLV
jgi:hypothetical protein